MPVQNCLPKESSNFKVICWKSLRNFTGIIFLVYMSNLVVMKKDRNHLSVHSKKVQIPLPFLKNFGKGMNAFHNKEYAQGSPICFIDAYQIDSTYAMNLYMIGEMLYQCRDFTGAGRFYLKAKEYDVLRFRAPEAINNAISMFCDQFTNVHFVDSESSFRKHSQYQILDDQLFMDHLHPNLFGYYLISDAFYNSILETQLIHGKVYHASL